MTRKPTRSRPAKHTPAPRTVRTADRVGDTVNDVFVGSSSEFLRLRWKPAKVIHKELDKWALPDGSRLSVKIWPEWFAGHTGVEIFRNLNLAAKTVEWAIIVFRADDLRRKLSKKSIAETTVRDNVLLELGLMYGYLGTDRVFILEESERKGRSRRIPDDINGIQREQFSDRKSFTEALAKVREMIRDRSEKPFVRWVPASSLAIGYCAAGLRSFVDERRTFGAAAGGGPEAAFRVHVLVPFRSFSGLGFKDVKALFEAAGYRQTGPDGSANGRPAMWTRKTADSKLPQDVYDIPTTLFTVESVISKHLGAEATPREIAQLVASQARDFVREIAAQKLPEVEVKCFPNIEAIAAYLRRRT